VFSSQNQSGVHSVFILLIVTHHFNIEVFLELFFPP
jgi:hypothetical protein